MTRLMIAFAAAFLTASMIVGCGSTGSTDAGGPRRSLTLWSRTTTQKFTYFELGPQGEFRYSGGRDAMWRESQPVTTLTRDQLAQVWSIVEKHKLADAPSMPFPDARMVHYELSLNTGGLFGRTITCGDDAVPGVKELHDLLFKLQGDVRYDHPAINR